jgi:hypothetical protein
MRPVTLAVSAVVRVDLEVLARISLQPENFDMVLENVIQLFADNRNLLETRCVWTSERWDVLTFACALPRAQRESHHSAPVRASGW